MGGGASVPMTISPRTMKVSKRSSARQRRSAFYRDIMKTYDVSKSGTLTKDEVRSMCEDIVAEVAPLVGVLESDVDFIMRVGGGSAKSEITFEELPDALSVILTLKSESISIHEMFQMFDVDKSGSLHKDQLSNFIVEVAEGVIPSDEDLDYIIKQCDVSGDGSIEEEEIKAAIMAWYCLSEQETAIPTSVEEAKSSGYAEEQIQLFLKSAQESGYNEEQIAEFMKERGIPHHKVKEEETTDETTVATETIDTANAETTDIAGVAPADGVASADDETAVAATDDSAAVDSATDAAGANTDEVDVGIDAAAAGPTAGAEVVSP